MPLYEYQCDRCDQRFEAIRKFSDPPVEKCPSCGGTVRKLFSSPAIQFKGSGFYITDYAKKDESATKESDKAGEKAEKAEGGESKDAAATKDTSDKGKSSSGSESSPSSSSSTPAASSSPTKDSKS